MADLQSPPAPLPKTGGPLQLRALLLACAVLGLGACDSRPAEPTAPAAPEVALADEHIRRGATSSPPALPTEATEPEDCLVLVWEGQEAPDETFDRANDYVAGGAISCATGTSASQFEAALASIRDAARAGDREALIREIEMPLLYIDAAGNRREVGEPDLTSNGFDEIFTSEMLEVMSRIELEDMTVVAEQGAFFELGSLWLVVEAQGGRPKLVTVNRQALDEAGRAAREAAEEGRGTPLELTESDTRA